MTYLVGKIALDILAGAPNNGRGENNVAMVKQMWINGKIHPYVSAQAFRRWLRDSLPADEPRSGVTRSGTGKNQQAYTEGRPDRYLDDDLFGYMVAVSKANYQRDTVLATGTFVAVTAQRPTRDFGTMSRGFNANENPVLHEHEHYSAELAGDVLLDLPRVGTFEMGGSGLRTALTAQAAKDAEQAGAEQVTFRGTAALRMPVAERRRRVALLLRTLAGLRGGAKRSLHYGDRTPAFALLAPVQGGVNPFTRVLRAQGQETVFDDDVLGEELDAWADELAGPVLIGWAPGFLGDQREKARAELADLIEAGSVVIDHPRVVLNNLAEQVEGGAHDDWFEDPTRMTEALDVEVRAPVVSFRNPLYAGVQVGLPCPPPSTVGGMLAAVAGGWGQVPSDLRFGMAFTATGQGVDLETYHPLDASGGKADPTPKDRPFLAGATLRIWLFDDLERWERALRRPVWPLRLGRSQDLATARTRRVRLVARAGRQEHAVVPAQLTIAGALLQLPTAISHDRSRTQWHAYRYHHDGSPADVDGGWATEDGQAVALLPPVHPDQFTVGAGGP